MEATADVISDHGIANTSVTRIIERAGLSRGMVHLHFQSKEDLLVGVARHMSEQYYAKLDGFLSQAGPKPQDKLEAIVTADLSEEILTRKSVNIWYAFRGEARSDNAFMAYSDTRDDALRNLIFETYLEIAAQSENPEMLARDATHGTIALLEGMWVDFFLHSDQFNRATAKRIVFRFVAALFPQAFDLQDGGPEKPN
ncbi:TetR family transcriptional regulator C-terminal domain-containing protein [Pelagibius sp. Alg239-R121]|uniref:TetR family transcriptional regulator C-terminal domain-containing protein n=1 Tax=Pelagibius sp. Alg239-R121 TaxID=2993448 RepID=UPI0024A726F1|nr:TetR family transcriptional regulator C-terminal domain-containing protein [Pelagibius sp. Alg239-R121]